MEKICVVGMGFVGLTLSAVLAQKGFEVFGLDSNKKLIHELKTSGPHFHEKGLKEALDANSAKIHYLTEHPKEKMDSYIICVGTPINQDKSVNNDFIVAAIESISKSMAGGELVMLRSTVKVGTCRNVVQPLLERHAKKYLLAFCPERAIEGKAIEEQVVLPQIIGGINGESAKKAQEFFSKITKDIVTLETIEEAEMVKLLNNSYRDLTFAFANEVALFCSNLGIDCNRIIDAANYKYARSNIPKPGFVGGTCLTKDSYILSQSVAAASKGEKNPGRLVVTAREINEHMVVHSAAKISNALSHKNEAIFFTGLAFKGRPETDDTRNSPSLDLIKELAKLGHTNIICHDFAISAEKISALGFAPRSLEEGARHAQCIIIGNNHAKYSSAEFGSLISERAPKIVFDPWRSLDAKAVAAAKSGYITL